MKDWKKKIGDILKELFPEKRKEILILTALIPMIWVLSLIGGESKEIKALLRPGFQEQERKVMLSYEVQGENAFAGSMPIVLKQYEEDAKAVRQKLEQAAEDLRSEWLQKENFRKIKGALKLPRKWKQAEVEYMYTPENLLLPEGDWNYFELFSDQVEREIRIGGVLRYREEEIAFSETVRIRVEDFDPQYVQSLIHRKLTKEVVLLQEESKSKLDLPVEVEGNSVTWKMPESRIDFKNIPAFLLIFLGMMSVLSKVAVKERIRKKNRLYLRDFGQMLHHLVLLMKCGKNPYSSIVEACCNKGKFGEDFKKAMQNCYQKIYHQENMKAAIAEFYEGCPLPEIKRFEQIFLMAYERGDEWSIYYLEQFRDELFAKRLREVNEYMQKTTSRLVFPMMLFLIIIIILTIVPAFEGM